MPIKTNKPIKLTLRKGVSETYVLTRLVNAASVNIPTGIGLRLKHFRVGDFIDYPEADALCQQRNYEVTVTDEK